MTELTVAHTSQVGPDTLRDVRAMVERAFGDTFRDHDWEHSLGGMHCIAWDGDEPVGHAAVVARILIHGDRILRTGYVEGVAVVAEHRRRGVGDLVMEAAERIVRDGYEVGALSATDEGQHLYDHRGWIAWTGPLSALTPAGVVPTPKDGAYVMDPSGLMDPTGDLVCDWRAGDVW